MPNVLALPLPTMPQSITLHDRMELAAALARQAVAEMDGSADLYARAGQEVWAIVGSLTRRVGGEAGLLVRRDALRSMRAYAEGMELAAMEGDGTP